LDECARRLRARHPECAPPALDLPGVLALIPAGGALVVPLLGAHGGLAFVVPHGAQTITDQHVLPLDGLTAHDLRRWLYLDSNPGTGGSVFGWKWAYWFRTGSGYWTDFRRVFRARGSRSMADAHRPRRPQPR